MRFVIERNKEKTKQNTHCCEEMKKHHKERMVETVRTNARTIEKTDTL